MIKDNKYDDKKQTIDFTKDYIVIEIEDVYIKKF